jgi:hypothetical protein
LNVRLPQRIRGFSVEHDHYRCAFFLAMEGLRNRVWPS